MKTITVTLTGKDAQDYIDSTESVDTLRLQSRVADQDDQLLKLSNQIDILRGTILSKTEVIETQANTIADLKNIAASKSCTEKTSKPDIFTTQRSIQDEIENKPKLPDTQDIFTETIKTTPIPVEPTQIKPTPKKRERVIFKFSKLDYSNIENRISRTSAPSARTLQTLYNLFSEEDITIKNFRQRLLRIGVHFETVKIEGTIYKDLATMGDHEVFTTFKEKAVLNERPKRSRK